MTYLQEIQRIEAYVEYRPQPEVAEDIIITIEFTPKEQSWDSDYQYCQPEFVFNDMVALKPEWEHCQKYHLPETELKLFRICAMELADCVTPSGELLAQPYWRYGIRCTLSKELMWLSEQALVRISPSNPDWF